jgi:hypothetical protein
MLSHQQYSLALRSKERSGTREAQCRKRVKLIKNLPVEYNAEGWNSAVIEIAAIKYFRMKV